MTYDPKDVDALIEAVKNSYHLTGDNEVGRAISALRPPKKYYTMPELSKVKFTEYGMPKAQFAGVILNDFEYNALREATASDKPLYNIPPADEWSDAELSVVSNISGNTYDFGYQKSLINKIKEIMERNLA